MYYQYLHRLPENLRFMPSVGNGHLATVVNTGILYVNGLYNGNGVGNYFALKLLQCVVDAPDAA